MVGRGGGGGSGVGWIWLRETMLFEREVLLVDLRAELGRKVGAGCEPGGEGQGERRSALLGIPRASPSRNERFRPLNPSRSTGTRTQLDGRSTSIGSTTSVAP